MKDKYKDNENISIEEIQQSLKKFIFGLCNQYLKFCQQINVNFYYVLIIIETLQILWFSIHPILSFLGKPLLIDYAHKIISFLNFQWWVRQQTSLLSIFVILSFGIVILNILSLIVSSWLTGKRQQSDLVKLIHRFAAIQFLLISTIFTIPLLTISMITVYCNSSSPYHTSRQCYNIEHICYCILSGIIIVVVLFQNILFIYVFYIKNPFSRCFLANPNNLWKAGKFLIKILPPLYFVIDYSLSYLSVYIYALVILMVAYIFFFRLFSLHNYNQNHFYFMFCLQLLLVWYSINNILNYYLNKTKNGGLAFIQTTFIGVLFVYLFYLIQKTTYQKLFIQNIKIARVKKQNIQKFLYSLIDLLFTYTKQNRCMMLVAVKLLNSKLSTCSMKVAQLFKNKQLKIQQQINILYQFLMLLNNQFIQVDKNLIILKVIRCHLLFHNQLKILSLHQIAQLQNDKVNLADQFLLYQFKNNYNIFAQHYQKQVHQQSSLVTVYYQFDRKLNKFQELIYQCTNNNRQYWQQLTQDNPSLLKLRDLANLYSIIMKKIQDVFNQLTLIFPNNLRSIYLYQKFLLYVGIDYKELVKVHQKIQIQKTVTNEKAQTFQQNFIKFRQNDNLCVVGVDTSENTFGIVLTCNKQIKTLLGFQKQQIIGSKISKIMPKIFHQIHDEFIKKFLNKKDNSTLASQKVVFSLNKKSMLLQIALFIKIIPHQTKAFQLIGFLKQIKRANKKSAFALISLNTGNIQAVNQTFVQLVNCQIDFTNLFKQPIHINSLFPDINISKNFIVGQQFDSKIIFNNHSQRIIQQDQQSQNNKSRTIQVKVIQSKYFNSIPLLILQIMDKYNFPYMTSMMSKDNHNQNLMSQPHIPAQNITSADIIEQLPYQRKIEDFIQMENKNNQFLLLKIVIIAFLALTLAGSTAIFIVNNSFQKDINDLFHTTNLSLSISTSQAIINLLCQKIVMVTSETPQIEYNKNVNELINQATTMKQNLVELIERSNRYNFPLQINQNNYYTFNILQKTILTDDLNSQQTYSDGIFQYVYNAFGIAYFDKNLILQGEDQAYETNQYIQLNGRQLLPTIASLTSQKYRNFFKKVLQKQFYTEIYYMSGKIFVILLIFLLIIFTMVKLNNFNQLTLQIYNSILLWDICQLKNKCVTFIDEQKKQWGVQDQIREIKTIQFPNRSSSIINILPKQVIVKLIQNQQIQTQPSQQSQHDALLQDNAPKARKTSFRPDNVKIKQIRSLKKITIMIIIAMIILMSFTSGYFLLVKSFQASIEQRQIQISYLGNIRKNILFIAYFSFQTLNGGHWQSYYQDLLFKQMVQFYKNAGYFYNVIGDPNPSLKSIYSKIQQLKYLILSQNQTKTIINPIYLEAQITIYKQNINLNKFSSQQLSIIQQNLLNYFRQIYIIRIITEILITFLMIYLIAHYFLFPLSQSFKQSINMIRMLPVWLIKKNKLIREIIHDK